MQTIVIIFVMALAAMNVVASIVALRSKTATPAQLTLQLRLVWLIPFLGAFLVVVFHRLDRRGQGPDPERMRLDGSEIDAGLGARHDGHN